MTLNLTRSEMLRLWKRIRAIEPLRLDCTADRTDGPDIDSFLIDQMRAWYLNLLDNAPESKIAPCECTDSARVDFSGSTSAIVKAPAGCRRILSVRFSGWDFPVNVMDAPIPQKAANPYCRRPAAFRLGNDRIAVIGPVGTLSELRCAIDVSDQVYIFDNSAILDIYDSAS